MIFRLVHLPLSISGSLLISRNFSCSYSNFPSPLVIAIKPNGSIRLTCNYKRVNQRSAIAVVPIPSRPRKIYTLSDLGRRQKVLSTLDVVSGLFSLCIHEESIPIIAVCAVRNWGVKRYANGLSFLSVVDAECHESSMRNFREIATLHGRHSVSFD